MSPKALATSPEDKMKSAFATSLSQALVSEKPVRDFLKSEALKMMDGDYDILYSLVKDKPLGNGKTFEATLSPYFANGKLNEIEAALPLLTIFIPTLPENSFSAELWDIENQIPFVAIRLNSTNDVPIISPEGENFTIPSHLIPSFPVIVIKNNERVTYSTQPGYEHSKSSRAIGAPNGLTYKFVDDGFDTELQEKNESKSLRDVLDFQIDQKLHDAFSTYSSVDGWQRDYIYYNISPSNPTGPFRYDFLETVTYFDIVGDDRAVYDAISDQTGDPEIKSGKKSSGWTDGYFEIRANALVQSKAGTGPNISNATYISGKNLFTVVYEIDKRGIWPFRYDFYIIKSVTAKPQYTNLSIVNWDLNRYAIAFRVDIEESDNTEVVTISSTETVEFASNFEFSASFGEIVKVGQKYGVTQKEIQTKTSTRVTTLFSDRLGEFVVNFEDKIITQDVVFPYADPEAYARIRDYTNGAITINVEPRRVQ